MKIGDSKSQDGYPWGAYLRNGLNVSTGPAMHWQMGPTLGYGGVSAQTYSTHIAGDIAAYTGPVPDYVILNLGANDTPGETGPTFAVAYATILDAINAGWPNAKVYCTLWWDRLADGAVADASDASISTAVAARAAWAFVGDDERVWLKGGDNGNTNTVDGVHYSEAGNQAGALAKQTAMGY